MYETARAGRSRTIAGIVPEGIARDFIREFLPTHLKVKNGLIFDRDTQEFSPQIDAIIYQASPLLEYTDIVIVEKERVKGIFEIKSWIAKNDIFGKLIKETGRRDPETGLIKDYKKRKRFLSTEAPYILFVFELGCKSSNNEIISRLKQICDMYAVVGKCVPRTERVSGQEKIIYNFDHSISKLIMWLRGLK
jgi:hypothetical protein